MKQAVVVGLMFGLVGATAAPAHAFGHRGGCCYDSCCAPACCETPCCQPTVTWVEKTVTCYRPEMHTREVPCTINRIVVHTEVIPQKCTIMVPSWSEEKRTITVCNCVPRQVEREVCCCRMVPVSCTDPCTGCTYTCCKPETYTQKVTCTIMEQVPVQKEITVRVCHYHPEERSYNITRCVPECKPETVTRTVCYCVMVPYESKIKVPVCTPCCQ